MQTCCEGGGWQKRKKTKKQTCLDLLIWDLDLLKSALFKTLVSKTLVTVVLNQPLQLIIMNMSLLIIY